MTVNICDHICALQWRNEYKRSSQLWTSSWNKTWKNSSSFGIWTHDLCDTSAALYPLSQHANMWTAVKKRGSLIFVSSPQCTSMISYIYSHYSPRGPAPNWLVSSVGGALHRYRRGHGFKSRTNLNFSGLISSTSSVVFIAARIAYIRLLIITMWDSRKEGQGRKKAEFTRIPTVECFSLHLMLDRSELKLPV